VLGGAADLGPARPGPDQGGLQPHSHWFAHNWPMRVRRPSAPWMPSLSEAAPPTGERPGSDAALAGRGAAAGVPALKLRRRPGVCPGQQGYPRRGPQPGSIAPGGGAWSHGVWGHPLPALGWLCAGQHRGCAGPRPGVHRGRSPSPPAWPSCWAPSATASSPTTPAPSPGVRRRAPGGSGCWRAGPRGWLCRHALPLGSPPAPWTGLRWHGCSPSGARMERAVEGLRKLQEGQGKVASLECLVAAMAQVSPIALCTMYFTMFL